MREASGGILTSTNYHDKQKRAFQAFPPEFISWVRSTAKKEVAVDQGPSAGEMDDL